MDKKEHIICAAIWFDDGIDRGLQELEGKTGFVVAGRRHHNCFHIMSILDPNRGYLKHEKEQGFITNTNRFVSRIEAAEIAYNAAQIKEKTEHPLGLFSEDLY